jgi:hypothetical protein
MDNGIKKEERMGRRQWVGQQEAQPSPKVAKRARDQERRNACRRSKYNNNNNNNNNNNGDDDGDDDEFDMFSSSVSQEQRLVKLLRQTQRNEVMSSKTGMMQRATHKTVEVISLESTAASSLSVGIDRRSVSFRVPVVGKGVFAACSKVFRHQ